MSWKICDIYLLESDQNGFFHFDKFHYLKFKTEYISNICGSKDLYFTSHDVDIKDQNMILNTTINEPCVVWSPSIAGSLDKANLLNIKLCTIEAAVQFNFPVIVSTTNKLLKLPEPKTDFLNVYKDNFNLNNVFQKCLINFEDCYLYDSGIISPISRLDNSGYCKPIEIVRIENNKVEIKVIKEKFTKSDFINALHKVELNDNKNYSELWKQIEKYL